jgi:ABC-type polysaccharide/polyol phosphate export permease
MNLVMLPMWIASGVFYSIERFPEAAQPILRLLPLTLLIDALRAVMQEGAPLASQWYEVGFCFVWGAVTFLLALRWFRWS